MANISNKDMALHMRKLKEGHKLIPLCEAWLEGVMSNQEMYKKGFSCIMPLMDTFKPEFMYIGMLNVQKIYNKVHKKMKKVWEK